MTLGALSADSSKHPIGFNRHGQALLEGRGHVGGVPIAGPALRGWPHNSANPTNSNGQSPGLTGSSITLGGHAGLFPKFVAGGACSSTLAAQASTRIVNKGFDSVNLDYKLTY